MIYSEEYLKKTVEQKIKFHQDEIDKLLFESGKVKEVDQFKEMILDEKNKFKTLREKIDAIIPTLPEEHQKVMKHYIKKLDQAKEEMNDVALHQISKDLQKAIQKLTYADNTTK